MQFMEAVTIASLVMENYKYNFDILGNTIDEFNAWRCCISISGRLSICGSHAVYKRRLYRVPSLENI